MTGSATSASKAEIVNGQDVERAATRLLGVAARTPMLTSTTLDEQVGGAILLKAENLQRAGAFKFRGAYNAIASLDPDQRSGIVAFSSGNHAQAVALSARILGARAVVLMPEDAPPAKLAATRGYGAEVVTYDRYTSDRVALASELVTSRGLTLIPPFDHAEVIAGQGTVALEMLEDVPDLDVLVAPISGGGLIAGCAVAAKHRRPEIRIIGVEPARGDDFKRSLASGASVSIPVPATIADGLQATAPGVLTLEIAQRLVDEVVTVDDEALLAAMVFLFERLKIVVEPSGAAGLAAVLDGRIAVGGSKVGVVLSGGNIGATQFAQLIG